MKKSMETGSYFNTGREEMAGRMLIFAANEYYAASVRSGCEVKDIETTGRTVTIRFKEIKEKKR